MPKGERANSHFATGPMIAFKNALDSVGGGSRITCLLQSEFLPETMKTKFIRQALPLLLLGVLAAMVTGCPHNDYTVELQPAGPAMVRTMTFYRADGVNTNTGTPNYQAFDPEELAAIESLYHTNRLTNDFYVHTVQSRFGNQMPDDVGGAGVYTNYVTSLGSAGFYVERFRGNEDVAGLTEQRLKTADQVTDLLIGWSQSELGQDPRYSQLHAFLDENFRHDLKNVSQYLWEGQVVSDRETNTAGEFIARVGQYLYERGYFKLEEIPKLEVIMNHGGDEVATDRWLQRLVARKMGVPDADPVPASLNFLATEASIEESFTNYFAHSDLYQEKLAGWKADADSADTPPNPDQAANDLFQGLIAYDLNIFGDTADHLTVKLALPSAPIYSNGHWDETNGREVWNSDIYSRTNINHLPFSCFATWADADDGFQTNHFGKVVIIGDDLVQYNLWRCGQDAKRAAEWDAFVSNLKPTDDLWSKVNTFRFAGETEEQATNNSVLSSALPRELLAGALR
jgi:hypothetical protein